MLTDVPVPASLLTARKLSKSAKLIWMCLQLPSPHGFAPRITSGKVHAWCGLARATIHAGTAELEDAGWLADATSEHAAGASIPIELLSAKDVGIQEKLLYGVLQLTPEFHDASGHFTYAGLSALAGIGFSTVKRSIRDLYQTGWLQLARGDKFNAIHFTLLNPAAEWSRQAMAGIDWRYKKADHKGETLMREYLNVIVADTEYHDDASPSYLLNSYTGAKMEFDRYYPPNVALEFNGPHHYGPTPSYPDPVAAAKQQARDHMKLGICVRRGIRLIVVHAEDLTYETMRQKVDGVLPFRDLRGYERIITHLDQKSCSYRSDFGIE